MENLRNHNNLKVTFIVPGFNDAPFIGRALDSCSNQTYDNLEIVAVNDGSTDETLQVMEDRAAFDKRIHVVNLAQNRGTHSARTAGVLAATGDIIMFLDGDDQWNLKAAARAVREYLRAPYDVLHFATRAVGDGQIDADRVKRIEHWFRPYPATASEPLVGREILEQSFRHHAYAFSVAAKAYPAALVKQAFAALSAIGDLWCDAGEDAMEYFAIGFFARVYRADLHRYYVYHLGDGGSEHKQITLEEFARPLRLKTHLDGINAFLESQGAFDEFRDLFKFHWHDQLRIAVLGWYHDVRREDKPAALKALWGVWPRDAVIEEICSLGTPAVAWVLEILGPDHQLTTRQLWLWGEGEGERCATGNFEGSASYKLGRALTAAPRLLRYRLGGDY